MYRPATSCLARWMESARNDFYEKIEKLVDPQRVETGTYLNDNYHCIVASIRRITSWTYCQDCQITLLKIELSSFRVEIRLKKIGKGNHLLQRIELREKTSLGWEIAPATHTFNCCHVRSIIKVVGKVSGVQPKWRIYVDLTDIFKELPRLQELDKERQKREESQQKKKMKKRECGRSVYSLVARDFGQNG